MSGKTMHIRKCKDGSYRLRFYHLHADQLETLKLALDRARKEAETEFDSVALEDIAMCYLVSDISSRPPECLALFLERYSADVIAAFQHREFFKFSDALLSKIAPLPVELQRMVIADIFLRIAQWVCEAHEVAAQKGLPEAITDLTLSMQTALEAEDVKH